MGRSSPKGRRRRARSAAGPPDARPGRLLLKGNDAVVAGLLVGFVLLFVGIALMVSGGADGGVVATGAGGPAADGGPATGDAGAVTPDDGAATGGGGATTSPIEATTGATQPAAGGEEAVGSLARRSIEVLPAGQWSSLYDSFTSEFRQRCPRDQFDQAGVDAADQLGDDLRLLRFKRIESVVIEGSSAEAVIVGEIVGQSEYQIQAAFQVEDGQWRIAPAPNTEGCGAFNRLSG